MNSRWEAHKIGLVDFWYYDEQEFHFLNGRMLLRGTNGSGKSVTMQSVVPLLLDGNMRPERIDPFGSRDRKMANYLIEENDGREERTGYLYMEFKRTDSETYLTIGIGMRARRGKSLENWYFTITDGRRINKDIYLYKETDVKITLTKKELENRLGSGGAVIPTQLEYMEYVNKQVFGFDSVDEYKEMIDLLIQLRQPKLSKDFKPSVINEILGDSLQPLSENDLRPMSEAIENMDALSTNLSSRNISKSAADKILHVYQRYNEFVLFQKAKQYKLGKEELKDTTTIIKKSLDQSIKCNEMMEEANKKIGFLEDERNALDKEKDSLNSSDAVYLKKQADTLISRIDENKKNQTEKNRQLDSKKEKMIELSQEKKRSQDQKESKQEQMMQILETMGECVENLSFDEYDFMATELKKGNAEEYDYQLHGKLVSKLRNHIDAGLEVIRRAEDEKKRLDKELGNLDREKKTRDSADRTVSEYENQLIEAQNELKEAIYHWNGKNQELKLSDETLRWISVFIEQYTKDSDYNLTKQRVGEEQDLRKEELQHKQNEIAKIKLDIDKDLETVLSELEEWEKQKEPEPECTKEVLCNREVLQEKNIPYSQFYKAIDFDHRLTREECDNLEESLLLMGILDALIIDEQYKETVLALDKGMCDRYIFADKGHVKESLLEALSVGEDTNDIFINQKIVRILGSIGYAKEGSTYISKNGYYGNGVLTGTISREYKAKYIGLRAREEHRKAKITELTTQAQVLQEQQRGLAASIAALGTRLQTLKQEYMEFPSDVDVRQAFHDYRESVEELERIVREIRRIEDVITAISEIIKEEWSKAMVIAEKIYLSCRLEVFLEAKENMEQYQKEFYILQTEHVKYLQFVQQILRIEEDVESNKIDMDNIRYDLQKYERSIQADEQEVQSVREQLRLTNYEEIKDRLNYCLGRLGAIPKEIETAIYDRAENSNFLKNLQETLEKNKSKKELLEKRVRLLTEGLKSEWNLQYVELPLAMEGGIEENVEKLILQLESLVGNNEKDELIAKLNQVYFDNRSYLVEYNLTMDYLFQEEDSSSETKDVNLKRLDIVGRYHGNKVKFFELVRYLKEEIEELNNLLKTGDRELFEDILANTISRKIRSKINSSISWVDKMNQLMESMNTSSGLKLSLRWRSKSAEVENQLDTRELVELLKRDSRLMKEEEFEKLSKHFRSKVEEARRNAKDGNGTVSFFAVMRDTLDYRKWFEFQLFSQKSGEQKKELTNSVFGTFSGGEKAMAMYVPLFSAVVAKYQGARKDAPRIISLDEAFAGVDNRNIRDMFRLMVEFEFNFIINSQVLWGDCDTLDSLAIYQLIRHENVKFVTVMAYIWNGIKKISVSKIGDKIE